MPHRYKIFADKVIFGTADYALNRVQAACRILDKDRAENAWRLVQGLAHAPQIPGKRVWYRIPHPDDQDSFISVHPGEYRKSRPTSGDDMILELSETSSSDTLANRLLALLDLCREDILDQSEIESLAIVVKHFTKKRPSSREGVELFANADQLTRSGDGNRHELTQRLFDECLLRYKLSLVEFSAAMTLFQLQAMMGQWIEQKRLRIFGKKYSQAYEDVFRSFFNYVHTLAASEHRQKLVEQLAEIGNVNYADAAAHVKNALNAPSLTSSTTSLVLGAHQYFIALLVVRAAERTSLSAPFRYKLVQAEEGYACTQTGLFSSISFLFNDPDDEPNRIARLLASGVSERRILLNLCSPFWPCFTKTFARVLIATARLQGSQFNRGLTELHNFEQEYGQVAFPQNVNFESGWIDHALLNAYRRTGNQERTRYYATRIAGQLIVTRALSGRR